MNKQIALTLKFKPRSGNSRDFSIEKISGPKPIVIKQQFFRSDAQKSFYGARQKIENRQKNEDIFITEPYADNKIYNTAGRRPGASSALILRTFKAEGSGDRSSN